MTGLTAVIIGDTQPASARALDMTVVLGLPIPSSSPLFLATVAIHVLFGLAAVITGALAMLSRKGRGQHSRWGSVYFWCLTGVFVSMSVLASMRWAEDTSLFVLGAVSLLFACFGRTAARRHWAEWPKLHLIAMGASYIVMLTAFYVDNGKNLPVWKNLPAIALWFVPSVSGVPLIFYALARHPLVQSSGR